MLHRPKPKTSLMWNLIIVDEDPAEEKQTDNDEENSETGFVSSDAINRRALAVAHRIKELVEVEKFEVYDKKNDSYRPCRWSDIVILTRAFEQRANNYVQILRCANIPVVSDSSAGYFATTEINDMLSLLQVLDNPRQDIPLASVLRSPLFGISDTELALIKSHQKKEGLIFIHCLNLSRKNLMIKSCKRKFLIFCSGLMVGDPCPPRLIGRFNLADLFSD